MSLSVINTPSRSSGIKHSRNEVSDTSRRTVEPNKKLRSEPAQTSSDSNWGSRLYTNARDLLNDPNMRPLANSLFPKASNFDQLALKPQELRVEIYPREPRFIQTGSGRKTVPGRARIRSLTANNQTNVGSVLMPIPGRSTATASSSSQAGQVNQAAFEPIHDLHQALEKMDRFNDRIVKQPIGRTWEGDLSPEMKDLFRSKEYHDCVAAHAQTRILLYYLMAVAFSDVKNDHPTVRNQGATLQMHRGGHEKLAACHHTLLANINDNYLVNLQNFTANQLFNAFSENRSIDPHLILKLLVLGVNGKQIQEIVEDCFSVYRDLDAAEAQRASRGHTYDANYVNKKFLRETAQKIEKVWNDTIFKPNPISLPDPKALEQSFSDGSKKSLFSDSSRFTYLNNQCLIGWQLNPVDDVIEKNARESAEINLEDVANGTSTPMAAVSQTAQLIHSNFNLFINEHTHLIDHVNRVIETAKELENAEYRLTNMGLSDHSQLLDNWCKAAENFQNANVLLEDYIQSCKTLTPEIIGSFTLNKGLVDARNLNDRLKVTKYFFNQIEATYQQVERELDAKLMGKQQKLESLKEAEKKSAQEMDNLEKVFTQVLDDPVWQEAEKLGWNADISDYDSYDKHRSKRDALLKSIMALGREEGKEQGDLFNKWKLVVNRYYSMSTALNNSEKKFEQTLNAISAMEKEIEELKLEQTALAQKKENHPSVKKATEPRAREIRHMHHQYLQQQRNTQKLYQCPIDVSVICQLVQTAIIQSKATEETVTKLRKLKVENQSKLISEILSPYIIQRNFNPIEKVI